MSHNDILPWPPGAESGIIDIVQDKTAKLTGTQPPHPVAVVVYDRVALMELGVACDIFGGEFTAAGGTPLYQLTVCGTEPWVSTMPGLPSRSRAAWTRCSPHGR